MVKSIEVTPADDVPSNTLAFSFTREGHTVEVCRFSLDEDGCLDVQIAPGIEMTDAARRFIGVIKDFLENSEALKLVDVEPHGRA